jgi:hypothetical protein
VDVNNRTGKIETGTFKRVTDAKPTKPIRSLLERLEQMGVKPEIAGD